MGFAGSYGQVFEVRSKLGHTCQCTLILQHACLAPSQADFQKHVCHTLHRYVLVHHDPLRSFKLCQCSL